MAHLILHNFARPKFDTSWHSTQARAASKRESVYLWWIRWRGGWWCLVVVGGEYSWWDGSVSQHCKISWEWYLLMHSPNDKSANRGRPRQKRAGSLRDCPSNFLLIYGRDGWLVAPSLILTAREGSDGQDWLAVEIKRGSEAVLEPSRTHLRATWEGFYEYRLFSVI